MTEEQKEDIKLLKELIADTSIPNDDREIYQEALNQILAETKSDMPKAEETKSDMPKVAKEKMPKKEKATPKTKASKKPKAEKTTPLPSDVDAMKKAIKERTGKTEAECEDIIAQYRKLRAKAKVNNAKRTEKLKSNDDLITGTNVITPVAQIEKDAEIVKAKIEKQVEQIENKAEREVLKKDKTKDEVKVEVEQKVVKQLAKLSDDMVSSATTFVKNIQTELKKVDKTEAKNFLLGLRNEIDALLSKFGDGGGIPKVYEVGIDLGDEGTHTIANFDNKADAKKFIYDYQLRYPKAKLFIDSVTSDFLNSQQKFADGGVVQTYNVTENMSASSVNPSKFAMGGGVTKTKTGAIKLYYHQTSGGAEYLSSSKVKGTKDEGSMDSEYIVRIDGAKDFGGELFTKVLPSAKGGSVGNPSKKKMLDYLNMYFDNYSELRTIAIEEDNILTRKMLNSLNNQQLEIAYNDALDYDYKTFDEYKKGGVTANNNDVRVKALIKNLDNTPYSIGLAILRERLLTYTQNDLRVMEKNPTTFDNPIISRGMYKDYFNRVIEELKFDYENGGSVDGDFAMGGGVSGLSVENLEKRLSIVQVDVKKVLNNAPNELLDYFVEGYENIGTLLSNIEIASDLTDNESDSYYEDGGSVDDGEFATGGGVGSRNLDGLETEIHQLKRKLVRQAKLKGISENFGQKEVRMLEDKYPMNFSVGQFDEWVQNFDLNSYAKGGGVRIGSDGREYPFGSAWALEHNKHNKNEKYEIPKSSRKS